MPKGNPGVKKSPEHIAKVRAALLGKRKSEAHREALRAPKSEAHKLALSAAQTKTVQAQRTKTMLARHGVAFSKQDPARNNTRPEYWVARGFSEDEASVIVSTNQGRVSRSRTTFGSQWKTSYWTARGMSEEEARRHVSAIQTRNAEKSDQTVSAECSAFLDELASVSGLEVEREIILCGRFKVDGFIPDHNAVIEYFGSFWHMHPDKFKPEDVHRVTGWKAASKWAEDAGRVKLLEASGYRVFVVWDHEATTETACAIAKELNDAG